MRSSGLVGVSTQSIFVSGRIAASTAARSVKSTKLDLQAGRALAHPLEQPERAAIDVVGGDDMGAGVEQFEHGGDRRQARGEGEGRRCRFRGRRRRARRRSASGSGCAHIRSPCARRGSAGHRSRSRRSAPSPRRSSGRGSGRHGWCASRRPGGCCRCLVIAARLRWLIRSMRVIRPTNSSPSKTIATSLRSNTGSSASSVWLACSVCRLAVMAVRDRRVEALPAAVIGPVDHRQGCRFRR